MSFFPGAQCGVMPYERYGFSVMQDHKKCLMYVVIALHAFVCISSL